MRYAMLMTIALLGLPLAAAGAEAPPAGGSISIEPVGGVSADRATAAFVTAASDALADKGFTILEDPGHSAYVADMTLTRTEVGTGAAKVRAGRGGATPGGAYGTFGAGVVVPLASGKSELVPMERIQLELRIRKRGEDAVVWHAAAVTVRSAGTRTGTNAAVAGDLTGAILRGYPVEPAGVVGVP